MKTWHSILCFLILSWFALPGLYAGEQEKEKQQFEFEDIDELNLEDLLNVTISIAAGRVQTLEEAPGIVSVVTDEEIRRMGARTLEEILETVPGFEVLTDNLGSARIIVRGVASYTSQNVLILFNGHRLNEDMNGGATEINFDIPVENIKKIEIIRGPGSALFGANAFSGVVNIVTQTAEYFDGVEVSTGGGSFGTQQYSVQFGKTIQDAGISGFIRYSATDGAHLPVPADIQTSADLELAPFGVPPASRAPGETQDARQGLFGDFRLAYKGWILNARIKDEESDGFIGFVDALSTETKLETRQILFDAAYQRSLGSKGSIRSKFLLNQNESRLLLELFPPGFTVFIPPDYLQPYPGGIVNDLESNTRRLGGEIVLDYRLFERNQFTAGLSYENESTFGLKTFGNFDPEFPHLPLPHLVAFPTTHMPDLNRDIASFFVQNTWNPSPELGLTGGLRYDHYNDFGDTLNPRAALVWRFAKDWNAKLLYGRAFRAPTFFELFFDIGTYVGNRNLKPSTIHTVEAALGYRIQKNLRVSVNYFGNFVRDYITLQPFQLLDVVTVVNTPGIDVHGLELELKGSFGLHHAIFVNYVYQNPQDIETGKRVQDVPSNMANAGATIGIGKYLSITPVFAFRGSRPRIDFDQRPDVKGYGLVHLTLRVRNFWETLEVSATIQNLFDQEYFDPSAVDGVPGDYPRSGRRIFVKAGYKF